MKLLLRLVFRKNFSVFIVFIATLSLALTLQSCGGSELKRTTTLPLNYETSEPQALAGNQTAGEQILKLNAPQGVDPQLFRQMKIELLSALAKRGIGVNDRLASKAPSGKGSEVADFEIVSYEEGALTLRWSYKNQGDGNEDGLANMQDIWAIALNFYKTIAEPGALLADYNEDGIVNLSDVYPLAENFFGEVNYYLVEMRTDGQADWTEVGRVGFDERIPDVGRDYFLYQVSFPQAPPYAASFRVVACDKNGIRATPSNERYFGAPRIMSVSPRGGREGEAVTFTAEVLGAEPLSFYWNFNGAGTPNLSEEREPTITLGAAGDYFIELTAQNAFGSDTKAFPLIVRPAGAPIIQDITPKEGYDETQIQLTAEIFGEPPYSFEWQVPEDWAIDNPQAESPVVTLGEPGKYEVTLTVKNELGEDSFTINFKVNHAEPTQILGISPYPVNLPASQLVTFSVDVLGTGPFTYHWYFSGGAEPNESNEASPEVFPRMPGVFRYAYVEVFGAKGSDRFDFVLNVGIPPSVNDVQPKYGWRGDYINFEALVTGTEPISYAWNFDGWGVPSTSEEESPTVQLNAPAWTYQGSLAVSSDFGADIHEFAFEIKEIPPKPEVLDVNPKSGKPNEEVTFIADVEGATPFLYTWDFGEAGNPSVVTGAGDSVFAKTTLMKPGRHSPKLSVRNTFGETLYGFTLTVGYNEVENNDTINEPNYLASLPVSNFWGNLGAGGYDGDDVDWFSFDATAGKMLIAKIRYDSQSTLVTRLYDQEGNEIGIGYGSGGLQVIEMIIPADGIYFLRILRTAGPKTDYSINLEQKTFVPWPNAVIGVPEQSVGFYPSLAVVDGRPAIGFSDNAGVYFAINESPDGSAAWSKNTVYSGIISVSSNLLLVEGLPAIIFQFNQQSQTTPAIVYFSRATTPDGLGAWTRTEIFELPMSTVSAGIFEGRPGMAYLDMQLKVSFAIAADSAGNGPWQTYTVEDAGFFGDLSAEVVDSRPAIAFTSIQAGVPLVRYAINSLSDGSGEWQFYDIDNTSTEVFISPSLKVIHGNPAVTYIDNGTRILYFARSQAPDGLGEWTRFAVDAGYAQETCLAVINGLPSITAYKVVPQDLVFLQNTLPDGSGEWVSERVDLEGDVGFASSLAEVAGQPATAYLQFFGSPINNSVVKYARRED